MDLNLAGKAALVTGGSRGIGLAIALALKAEGARVAVNARDAAALERLGRTDGFAPIAADVSDPTGAETAVAQALTFLGGLDIVVCNVGGGRSVPPGEETPEEWRRVLDLNLGATTNMIGAARAPMAARGGGVIVCISSICGSAALGAPVTYSAAKAALDMTIRGLARPLAADNIRLVGLAPGNVMSPDGVWARRSAEDPDAVADMLAREVPQNRIAAPEEIADIACFLASSRAGYITGEIVVADGGQLRA